MLFDSKYEVFISDSHRSKLLSYNIRHKIYCLETGFENLRDFPFGIEFDKYDENAVHFVARRIDTKQWVGTVRIVLDELQNIPSRKFIQKDIQITGSLEYSVFNTIANNVKVGEISRLGVLEKFRKSGPDCAGVNGKLEGLTIMTGLLRAAYRYCHEYDIQHCFFSVTPSLSRVLKNIGFRFCSVGELTDYHGKRIPNYCYIPTFAQDLDKRSHEMDKMFHSSRAFSSFERYAGHEIIDNEAVEIEAKLLYAV